MAPILENVSGLLEQPVMAVRRSAYTVIIDDPSAEKHAEVPKTSSWRKQALLGIGAVALLLLLVSLAFPQRPFTPEGRDTPKPIYSEYSIKGAQVLGADGPSDQPSDGAPAAVAETAAAATAAGAAVTAAAAATMCQAGAFATCMQAEPAALAAYSACQAAAAYSCTAGNPAGEAEYAACQVVAASSCAAAGPAVFDECYTAAESACTVVDETTGAGFAFSDWTGCYAQGQSQCATTTASAPYADCTTAALSGC